jgi:hypothetical protein
VSGDAGFPSGENRAACHNIRLDIRVIALKSGEPYGRALSSAPLLLRDFEWKKRRGLRPGQPTLGMTLAEGEVRCAPYAMKDNRAASALRLQ